MKRAITLAKRLKVLKEWELEFMREYHDDSDSVNNSDTNGYFPARPSELEIERYERCRNLIEELGDALVIEVLKTSVK